MSWKVSLSSGMTVMLVSLRNGMNRTAPAASRSVSSSPSWYSPSTTSHPEPSVRSQLASWVSCDDSVAPVIASVTSPAEAVWKSTSHLARVLPHSSSVLTNAPDPSVIQMAPTFLGRHRPPSAVVRTET